MQLFYGTKSSLISLLLCVHIGLSHAFTPIQLPIFDFIFQRTNNFNESIHDTNTFMQEYDFIIIGSGSG